ncbi:MAG: acyl-CoA thioesterase [Phycisphaerales bacterium]|nr:acyl-CoA thioesterase [Phycisphaerales bacterium]
MTTTLQLLDRPPAGAPAVPHPDAMWATLTPAAETSSGRVDHVYNVEYVRWLDILGQRHLAELGWHTDNLLASGGMWFVARHEIDYRLEAKPGETLIAATWVRSLRRVKSWRDVMVWRPDPEGWQLVCTAATLWVHVDLDTRRGTRPPADMVDAMAPLGADAPPWAQSVGRR